MVSVEADNPFILLTGDTRGISVDAIHRFVEATGHPPYGGGFPIAHDPEESEVIEKTSSSLRKAGISNPDPIILCHSKEEEASRLLEILQDPTLLSRSQQHGLSILIIDRDPVSLMQAVRSNNNLDPSLPVFSHTTIINLRLTQPIDYVDLDTGIRIVTTPPYCYPTHPTPAS